MVDFYIFHLPLSNNINNNCADLKFKINLRHDNNQLNTVALFLF